jgi:hypothetical protein
VQSGFDKSVQFRSYRIRICCFSIAVVFTTACSFIKHDPQWFTKALNNDIGKNFSGYAGKARPFYNLVRTIDGHDEYERIHPGGCSYVLVVRKSDDIIVSWRYTSAPSICNRDIWTGTA